MGIRAKARTAFLTHPKPLGCPRSPLLKPTQLQSDHPQGARMPRSIILSLALIAAPSLLAQTAHTTADLKQHEAKLLATAKASPTGLASETMDDYGNDRTMLIVRVHTGGSERHQFWADQMVILSGTVTLITGGTMQQEHPNGTSPGETIGDGVDGGKEV